MCGVLGVIANKFNGNSKQLVDIFFEMFHMVQHRGQDACGIAYSDGRLVRVEKNTGFISQVFHNTTEIKNDQPLIMMGHTRYPTKGGNSRVNTQPHYLDTGQGRIALISNGDIPGYQEERKKLEQKGVEFLSNNDGELILRYLYYHADGKKENLERAIQKLIIEMKAAYSSILMTKEKIYIFRDLWGVRPLTIIKKDGFIIVSSETCVVDDYHLLPKENILEVKPGSLTTIDLKHRIVTTQLVEPQTPQHCIFEQIYLGDPSSQLFGSAKQVFTFRYFLGRQWAEELKNDLTADELKKFIVDFKMVTPVPDSGTPFAHGVATGLGMRFRNAINKNRYIPRTFINESGDRTRMIRLKFRVLMDIFHTEDNTMLGCDDSIVRGTTTRSLMNMIKQAGAKKIGMAVSCPPLISGCKLGINLPDNKELIANEITPDEIRDFLGINYLKYLSLDGLKAVIKKCGLNPDHFCYGCFTGDYGPFDVNFE